MRDFFAKNPILKNKRTVEIAFVFFVFLCAFLIFFLDVFIGGKISFYIFYFPAIAVMAWYFGRVAGWAMVVLCAGFWFVKQWDLGAEELGVVFFWNGMICLASFCAICGMTLAIRDGQIKLRKRSQELEEFAFRAAHELKAPIANILGYAELLEEKLSHTGDVASVGFVKSVSNNVKRMMAMIKGLLDYAKGWKVEAGVSPVKLEKILKETLETLAPVIAEKKAEVRADLLPSVAMHPGLAGLLLQNLIGNALKYCEQPPRIRVSARLEKKEWTFSVKDNGIGIRDEDRERIFIMFEKIPTQHSYPGSGIGLATCQKIVEHYGGRIWVESKFGEGTTFFFTLPHDAGAI